ncbi:hypothetical protein BSU04_41570 [Caballeronia sordidicola]|uniref:Uncharacterized protein n=1 Tax=Caballeronia sordidicola TaxID=196367 RepID=A0A226WN55_CABSO|nr:hypothetical protein BSU04_41570 [Caballeronia sordidicola]
MLHHAKLRIGRRSMKTGGAGKTKATRLSPDGLRASFLTDAVLCGPV